jgi:hypothetical protein
MKWWSMHSRTVIEGLERRVELLGAGADGGHDGRNFNVEYARKLRS